MRQVLLTDEIQGCDVAVELGLLLKKPCDEWALEMLWPQSTEQKLGIGAQGSQWVAQLMHHKIHLLALLMELVQ